MFATLHNVSIFFFFVQFLVTDEFTIDNDKFIFLTYVTTLNVDIN